MTTHNEDSQKETKEDTSEKMKENYVGMSTQSLILCHKGTEFYLNLQYNEIQNLPQKWGAP